MESVKEKQKRDIVEQKCGNANSILSLNESFPFMDASLFQVDSHNKALVFFQARKQDF